MRALKNSRKSSRNSLSKESVTFSATTSELAAKFFLYVSFCSQSYVQDHNLIEHVLFRLDSCY